MAFCCSVTKSCLPWTVAPQAFLSCTISQSLLKFMAIELVMTSNHLILCHPAFPFCPQSCPASESFPMSWLFTWGSQSIEASASASVLPMNIQGWFPLGLTAWCPYCPRTLKNLFQHHSLKASPLWCSAFFMVKLSHPYLTTGETIALTVQTFVGKVMSLLFNILSTLVIAFLLKNKCLLISWVQSPSALILEPKKIKSVTISTFPHLFAMKWWDWMHLGGAYW